MAKCYSSTFIFDRRFVKFIDTQSTCAFHYLHNGCNLIKTDPPRETSPDDIIKTAFGCDCDVYLPAGCCRCLIICLCYCAGVSVPRSEHR